MKFKLVRYVSALFISIGMAMAIISCSNSNQTLLTSPSETERFASVHYLRKDANYNNWGLHIWNDDNCNGALDSAETPWDAPLRYASKNTTTGVVYKIFLKKDATCMNYIIHKGNKKDGGTNIWQVADGKTIYTVEDQTSGSSTPLTLSLYNGEKAIFIGAKTIALPSSFGLGGDYSLLYSEDAALTYKDKTVIGGKSISLKAASLSATMKAKYPHLKDYKAFEIVDFPEGVTLAKLLKMQLHIVANKSDSDELFDATGMQLAPVLDAIYSSASSEVLGAILTGRDAIFKVWAPTAQDVRLHIFDDSLKEIGNGIPMTEDARGVWISASQTDVVGKYYRYEVKVYHPQNELVEARQVTDPYSLNVSMNSNYSQVVDLNDSHLKPASWDSHKAPTIEHATQHVIYETHLRDLSVSDTAGTRALDGKFMAVTENERESVKHLKALAEAGVNTIHLLNVFDIATINDDPTKRVDLNDTVGDLCKIKADAKLCGVAAAGATLQSVLSAYDPTTGEAQALMNDLRDIDSFNWGYDPYHFGAVEGSYASNASGTTRIKEYRTLILTLHSMGFRVVMDVVYNHTNESGISDKSVLDKIVPGYYQRLNASGDVETSTCCSNTATENMMMGKLMTDTLLTWTKEYKIDGFRFDLMGHQPKDLMVETWEKIKAIDPDNYFYGEGWNFGEVVNNARFMQASQFGLAGTGIGTFSDRLRDAVRGGGPFDSKEALRKNQGFANSAIWNEMVDSEELATTNLLNAGDLIRIGMAGNLKDFLIIDNKGITKRGKEVDYNGQEAGYNLQPQENISYVSKHDNQTLWDNNMYKVATEVTSRQRAKMQVIALSAPLLGQGIPFIHLGSELLRSKSMERDSYDSGDWFNAVKFNLRDNNWNVGLPRKDKDGDNWPVIKTILADTNAKATPADIVWTRDRILELIKIRTSSPLFSLETANEISKRLDFWNTGADQIPGLIVMSIDDGSAVSDLDPSVDAIVVVINSTNKHQDFPIAGASGFVLSEKLKDNASTFAIKDGNGVFSVPALTVAVFKIPQAAIQGGGLPVKLKSE